MRSSPAQSPTQSPQEDRPDAGAARSSGAGPTEARTAPGFKQKTDRAESPPTAASRPRRGPIRSQGSRTSTVRRSHPSRKGASVPLRYAVASAAGLDAHGQPKVNQDAYSLRLRFMGIGTVHLMLVADGHGAAGHHVAQAVVDGFPRHLEHHARATGLVTMLGEFGSNCSRRRVDALHETVARAARGACLDLDQEIANSTQIDDAVSGSTLIALLIVNRTAFVVNVGDSRCVLGHVIQSREDVGEDEDKSCSSAADCCSFAPAPAGPPSRLSSFSNGIAPAPAPLHLQEKTPMTVGARPLSFPHVPTLPSERARIERMGGVVQPIIRPDGSTAGPQRVWAVEAEYPAPGLAVSRTLGDRFAKGAGVIAAPSVSRFALLPSRDVCIVLASDGVWDVLHDQRVMQIARNAGEDACKAAADICYAARDVWVAKGRGRRRRIDDITAFAVLLWPGKSPKELLSLDKVPASLAAKDAKMEEQEAVTASEHASPKGVSPRVARGLIGRSHPHNEQCSLAYDACDVGYGPRSKSAHALPKSSRGNERVSKDRGSRSVDPALEAGASGAQPKAWRSPFSVMRALARAVGRTPVTPTAPLSSTPAVEAC